ncbi:MAG: hypothetical protein WDZ80_01010 [Candidatus Paceibacterota bacterium]
MKPIFTIHAGEYLVASRIEKKFKGVNVWLPSKDTGIDLLLTDKTNKKTASIQVKFSKDFNTTHIKENLRPNIKGTGWWTLRREKIESSKSDFWVFVIYSFEKRTNDFVVIKPRELVKMYEKLDRGDRIHSYITVTTKKTAFETRGLSKSEMQSIGENKFENKQRALTQYLNNWTPVIKMLS